MSLNVEIIKIFTLSFHQKVLQFLKLLLVYLLKIDVTKVDTLPTI